MSQQTHVCTDCKGRYPESQMTQALFRRGDGGSPVWRCAAPNKTACEARMTELHVRGHAAAGKVFRR